MRTVLIIYILIGILPKLWASSTQNAEFETASWSEFESYLKKKKNKQSIDGLSYIISGSMAIAGGLLGQNSTDDPAEKGVYTLFQSMGVGAIGYGISIKSMGDEDSEFYQIINNSKLPAKSKSRIIESYYRIKKERQRKTQIIKALTYATIAGLNIYSASQQDKGSAGDTLYVIGGVNVLLSLSYAF